MRLTKGRLGRKGGRKREKLQREGGRGEGREVGDGRRVSEIDEEQEKR